MQGEVLNTGFNEALHKRGRGVLGLEQADLDADGNVERCADLAHQRREDVDELVGSTQKRRAHA